MRTSLHAPLATAVLLASTLAQAGWFGTNESGNGKKVTESRNVRDFKRVVLKSAIDVEIKRGADFAVRVTTDSNLMPLLITTVEGDALVIANKSSGGMRMRGKNVVAITLPDFRGLSIQGSGDGVVSGFAAERDVELMVAGSGNIKYEGGARGLKVRVEGSGDVKLSGGKASALEVSVEGSGDVDASGLPAHDVNASIDGSGDVNVNVTGGNLSAAVNGSGDIVWTGDGKLVSAVKHGSGEISHR